jgi:hypothetical protein
MYYSDFTPYCYIERTAAPNVLNIGWLETPHPFPRNAASEELLDALFEKCLDTVNQTRGWHDCQFCDVPPTLPLEVSRSGKNLGLGSAEIRVNAKDGRIYAAPNLIYHYVSEHDYDPPPEFVEALFSDG